MEGLPRPAAGVCRLYLCRHARTTSNAAGLIQGAGTDAPLDAKGVQQTELLADALRSVPLDAVYCSPLRRAVDSARPLLRGRNGLRLQVDPRLSEMHYGDLEGVSLRSAAGRAGIVRIMRAWAASDEDHKCPGQHGESYRDVASRGRAALSALAAGRAHVAVVTHFHFLRVLLCDLLGRGPPGMESMKVPNAGVWVCDYDPRTEEVRVVARELTAHL
eukprot:TRINITY_DN7576_c0_g1_i1.p2 TRINITY_DN7576_c0_g1~~TRINITY_DN7576_c0_g1_i1.p2  ORF type:complete len:217 (+),score=49.33 TRINITY_DN7576_c0_g1_i1:50-700(+)